MVFIKKYRLYALIMGLVLLPIIANASVSDRDVERCAQLAGKGLISGMGEGVRGQMK